MLKEAFILLLTGISILSNSCQKADPEKEAESVKRSYEAYLPEVTVTKLVKQDFNKELISNGTLVALRKADIKASASGQIVTINRGNGQWVSRGSHIATLDDTEVNLELQKRRIELDQAFLEFNDQLISYGKSIPDTATMNQEALKTLKIKSGYITAQLALYETQQKLYKTKIRAPFSGRIADLELKIYNYINEGDDLCELIDDSSFEVLFPVIESELQLVEKGQSVVVKPYAINATYNGVITTINPKVDENGLVMVRALVKNKDGLLVEGLNVRVITQRNVPEQLVIPKEALLQRDGRQVVFTLRPDSTAYWNYVQTGFENVDSYTITEGLQEGEWIITDGNLNLAHESRVKRKSGPGTAQSNQASN